MGRGAEKELIFLLTAVLCSANFYVKMPPTNKQPNTVLVAIINDRYDYDRLLSERWYRIPIDIARRLSS